MVIRGGHQHTSPSGVRALVAGPISWPPERVFKRLSVAPGRPYTLILTLMFLFGVHLFLWICLASLISVFIDLYLVALWLLLTWAMPRLLFIPSSTSSFWLGSSSGSCRANGCYYGYQVAGSWAVYSKKTDEPSWYDKSTLVYMTRILYAVSYTVRAFSALQLTNICDTWDLDRPLRGYAKMPSFFPWPGVWPPTEKHVVQNMSFLTADLCNWHLWCC